MTRSAPTPFPPGTRVEWQEGGALQYTCSGRVICEEVDRPALNLLGWHYIRVDDDSYAWACRTAREMHEGAVVRSTELHRLRPEVVPVGEATESDWGAFEEAAR